MPGVWGLKYEENSLLCGGVDGVAWVRPIPDSGRLSIYNSVSSTLNYELKHLRAYQSGDELIPEEVSELGLFLCWSQSFPQR